MAEYDAKNIRNIAILGHSSAGKTSVAEHLLSEGGAIPKPGSINEGNTVSDYNKDEIERKISINSSALHVVRDGVKVNIIDTPGYSDFVGEVISALSVVEGALIVVNAVNGIETGTNQAFKFIQSKNIPAIVFINRMDKENADFNKCVEALQNKFGKKCVVTGYPIGKESSFKGVANLLTKEGVDSLSGTDKDDAKRESDMLVESVAESDDALLEKYLDKGELSTDEIKDAFRKGVVQGKVIPIIAGSTATHLGIKELLNAVINYLPSPADAAAKEGINPNDNSPVRIEMKKDAPFSACVFKTISDPYVGQITVFKVFSGSIAANATVYNVTKRAKEKISQLSVMQGKQLKGVDALSAGDIGCVMKLKDTGTNDSLGDEKNPIQFPPISFPEPAMSFSIKPKTQADEDKISSALHRLVAEDTTLKAVRDAQTKEEIISGMGDLHLNIVINRLKDRFGVSVDIGTPKVAYKETIITKGDAQYRHKKQSGGAGQFAEVWLRVEPLQRGEGFQFVSEVVGGSIPAPFIVSCEKGVKTALDNGSLAGYPVVDVKVVVYDGKTHPVDSKDIAFQVAARHAFREAFLKAKPILLEPIMDVDVTVPDEYMGSITGSLNSRRGRILGMEPGEGAQTIKAKVPLEEMYKYVNELKSITAGRGTYTMKFSHHEQVPSNVAQNIIQKAQAAKVEEKEE
ncbi:MAG: elongation factor G [Candidatus Omnitrophica bacterium]|nr:elongation factor G [Candidatus Omnitrophota bacterium]MCG2705707.1 elongation factor G [Candidatus Omnitrophota bacterium]